MQAATAPAQVESLYRARRADVLAICEAELASHEDAEDLTEEIFLSVCQQHTRPTGRGLARAIRNRLINRGRYDAIRDEWTPRDREAKSAFWRLAYGEDITPLQEAI